MDWRDILLHEFPRVLFIYFVLDEIGNCPRNNNNFTESDFFVIF